MWGFSPGHSTCMLAGRFIDFVGVVVSADDHHVVYILPVDSFPD